MKDIMQFGLPKARPSIIKVIGVGGGGCNAVNYMFQQGINDVEFVICNTDAQALELSPIPLKVQLGATLTSGLGAGSKPSVGCESARESLNDIEEVLGGATKMVFITAGMGGGTGTGAAPVIAQKARELGLLTVGIVTIPFLFEGEVRVGQALDGVEEIQKYVDALLVISNQKLREIYGDLKLSNAFTKADDVLLTATKGIAEIITLPGYINVDFADVQTVMKNSGVAVMGMGSASGEDRAIQAIRKALISPLLNNNDIRGAKNILLNITSGTDEITMDEVGLITDYVQEKVGQSASIIWGTGHDVKLDNMINVTIIATGFSEKSIPELVKKKSMQVRKVTLDDLDDVDRTGDMSGEKDDSDATLNFDETDAAPRQIDFTEKEKIEKARKAVFYGGSVEPKSPVKSQFSTQQTPIGLKNKLSVEEMENDNLIDLIENIPAYQRGNLKPNASKPTEISGFKLSDNIDDITISDRNPYLHDNVD
jgi:cell division protein FtsZ